MAVPTTCPSRNRSSPEFFIAVTFTLLVVVLHFYFYRQAGGLWRDEVNSVNIGQGNWASITHDSFPILFPLCIRVAGWLGLQDWRLLGLAAGLTLTAAFWLAAQWTRRVPPVWSLALVGLNAWVIGYDSSLRAYGLGSALIVLCFGAGWRYLKNPVTRNWWVFAAAAILSVQTLYHNVVLVGAICLAGMIVAILQRNWRAAAGVFSSGLAAAISLLAYWHDVSGIAGSEAGYFDLFSTIISLHTLLAFPLRQYAWVWWGLGSYVFVVGLFELRKPRSSGLPLFAATVLGIAVVIYFCFLWAANYLIQIWYFLPLLSLAGICLESSLPRPQGRLRALIFGGLLATALVSAVFGLRILDWRMTNVDLLARRIVAEANPKDYVIIKPWTFGQTFDFYFKGSNAWSTIPPIADLKTARYDLYARQENNTNAVKPVLEDLGDTLRSGHQVWLIGNLTGWKHLSTQTVPVGLNELIGAQFNQQINDFLRAHCEQIECLDAGTNENVNYNERAPLYQCRGWRENESPSISR